MGSLRLILALSVFLTHTGSLFGISLVGSSVAVQSFFIISGFYMALVLNEKYKGPGSYYLFITNRFLRLLPAYWVVLVLIVLMIYSLRSFSPEEPWVSYNLKMFFHHLDIKAQAAIIFSNLFIIGQDLFRMLGIDPQSGAFVLTKDPMKGSALMPPVLTFFFNPPAWSIGTELLFYLVAPFLVRGKKALLALLSLSLLLRVVMFYSGYTMKEWQFQFFPTELALFLLGALSYKLYQAKRSFFSSGFGLYATIFVIAATVFYQFMPGLDVHGANMKKWGYYVLLIFLIPGAFSYTSASRVDRYLGDLSYPVYVVHYAVLWLWVLVRDRLLDTVDLSVLHLGMLALTLLLSVALFHLVIKPMEGFRQSRVKSAPPLPAAARPEAG
jgi:peptidoglycan/LPS O-acetylase OafA/YrhL